MPRLDVTALRTDFKQAAEDHVITRPEVKRIIRRARRGDLHEREAKTFRREARRYKDQFSTGGASELKAFIDNRLRRLTVLDEPPRPLGRRDPKVLKSDLKRLQQEIVKGGSLFRHGVNGKDPEQNYIGDCYLVGAMSAVAFATPEAIEKLFKRNQDGTFDVTLWGLNGRKYIETVDIDLPRNGWYGYYYARSNDPKELWPALLEKAFAQWKGSYQAIEGGVPGDAMTNLTGKPSVETDLHEAGVTPESVYQTLKAALAAKKPTVAATFGARKAAMYKGTGLHEDHTYAVFGVRMKNGQPWVKLRNPWGESEPKNNGRDDGIFEIPISKLIKYCDSIAVNG
jgi:hypothetical protein